MRIAGAAIAVALATGAHAQTYEVYGVGQLGCSGWTASPSAKVSGDQWVLGFWSAMNVFNAHNKFVGTATDGPGILSEVTEYCRQHPSMTLDKAVIDIYVRMDSAIERQK